MKTRNIPANSVELKDPKSDAVAYLYDYNGRPAVTVFVGRRTKPERRMVFNDTARRDEVINQDFKLRQSNMEYAASRSGPHTLSVGDIMVSTWGHEQTNVDFYQVVKTTDKSVYVREIKADKTFTSDMTGKAVAIKDSFKSDEINRFKCGQDNRIKLSSYAHARQWDGSPVSWSSYA